MERVPIEKLTTPYKQKEKIDRLLKSQKVEGSKYIGNIMGAYRTKEIVPASFYGEGKMYPFEDIQLRGMDKYDEYLTWTYGDYMQLPPVEQRIEKHSRAYLNMEAKESKEEVMRKMKSNKILK